MNMDCHIFIAVILGLVVNAFGKHLQSSIVMQCQLNVEFFNLETGDCEKCSVCKDYKVTIQPCGPKSDTVCGRIHLPGFDGNAFLEMEKSMKSENIDVEGEEKQYSTETIPLELVSDKWYRISMGMLGFLCFLCLCICIGVACYLCKKKSGHKEVIYHTDPEFLRRYPVSEEPRYVEVLSSRERLLRHPWSSYRLNAHDSLTLSGLAPISPLHMPKTNIYVNMLDYTTTDDDYVYIE